MLFQVQKSKVLDSHPRPHECISELLLGLGDSIGTRDVMSVRCLHSEELFFKGWTQSA